MCRVKNCCCCHSLRSGTLIIGYLGLILNVSTLIMILTSLEQLTSTQLSNLIFSMEPTMPSKIRTFENLRFDTGIWNDKRELNTTIEPAMSTTSQNSSSKRNSELDKQYSTEPAIPVQTTIFKGLSYHNSSWNSRWKVNTTTQNPLRKRNLLKMDKHSPEGVLAIILCGTILYTILNMFLIFGAHKKIPGLILIFCIFLMLGIITLVFVVMFQFGVWILCVSNSSSSEILSNGFKSDPKNCHAPPKYHIYILAFETFLLGLNVYFFIVIKSFYQQLIEERRSTQDMYSQETLRSQELPQPPSPRRSQPYVYSRQSLSPPPYSRHSIQSQRLAYPQQPILPQSSIYPQPLQQQYENLNDIDLSQVEYPQGGYPEHPDNLNWRRRFQSMFW